MIIITNIHLLMLVIIKKHPLMKIKKSTKSKAGKIQGSES